MTQAFDQWPQGGFDGSRPGGVGDDFGDLDSFAGDYRPEAAFPLDIDSLAAGDYDFQILAAELKKTQAGDRVCELSLQVLGGRKVRWTWWLNKQMSLNKHCADLTVLGFPAQTWGSGPGLTPLSQALPAAIGQLTGKKFRGYKSARPKLDQATKKETGQHWHDLTVSCVIDGRPMPPLTPPCSAAAADSPPVAIAPAGDEVPF